MGFGASSAYGGPCRMPTAEKLAGGGLSYSRFHTTALCSPTRAALLSGRNHHTCGMGAIPELATPAPGYTARRPDEVATIARMLQLNGYATGAFGKMHQTPSAETSPVGPFDRWPQGDGFDKFYGFLGAEANQFAPSLIDGFNQIDPPRTAREGYHLSEDLVDQAMSWIRTVGALDPEKPWFTYLSFGACHAPFHVPAEWRNLYHGKFDHGWDEQRNRTLKKQKEMGLVPNESQLAPWAEGVDHWDALSDTQRTTAARLMEIYAAFAEHTDAQVGRLVEALEQSGELENTLIFYILGDNGASAEGGLEGTLNEYIALNGLEADTSDRIAARLEEVGGPMTYPHYPVGWALAMDTPYAWAKQVASHYGGTRNGMITHWPRGIQTRGEIRHQWHHVIDIVPTILEAANLPAPLEVDGFKQHPLEGTSFLYTFNDPGAEDRHTSQYFEMFGNRGLYEQGWTAVTKHRTPWETGAEVNLPRFDEDVWELYDTTTDWTQAHNVAADYPEKLAELQEKFLEAAERYRVLPLDDRFVERLNPELAGREDLLADRHSIVLYPGMPGLHDDSAPNVKNTSFVVTASVEVPERGGEGVIVAQGGRFGGWSL
ncbi:sulfatase-like hydrolase/transferase [Rhodococcus ruber]|uniref:sulfatase-like hydrolase/transferase n=1 Tax=Rhodococcus ruber TaxID=1830 RepID=UPI00315CE99C